jgi:hypothetical protein
LENISKSVGYWKVENIALYYSFIFRRNKLLASKYFSIIAEDYVEIKYTEKIVDCLCQAENIIMKDQPGINVTPITKNLITQTLKRYTLPENGENKILPESL